MVKKSKGKVKKLTPGELAMIAAASQPQGGPAGGPPQGMPPGAGAPPGMKRGGMVKSGNVHAGIPKAPKKGK